jgi:hypothetical protein
MFLLDNNSYSRISICECVMVSFLSYCGSLMNWSTYQKTIIFVASSYTSHSQIVIHWVRVSNYKVLVLRFKVIYVSHFQTWFLGFSGVVLFVCGLCDQEVTGFASTSPYYVYQKHNLISQFLITSINNLYWPNL